MLMLTAKGEEYDELFGFQLGADDYISKPFNPSILVARIGALLKRSFPKPDDSEAEWTKSGLTVKFASCRVLVDERVVELSADSRSVRFELDLRSGVEWVRYSGKPSYLKSSFPNINRYLTDKGIRTYGIE
ncbi:hypothetical protein PACILC2_17290 [Paenibacillus cisolokensis]|uniref:Response regulatory domain-containing protein n=2 Tax=Paenibacillus cisolokensis TaxID=1658519 RepID=A0ABQ4N4T3_9BACL|nr:hypothetical protein PACILC2_17290 [Paenibacillus cisolokensis]